MVIVILAVMLLTAGVIWRSAEASGRRNLTGGCKVASNSSGPDLGRGFGAGAEGTPPEGWSEADTRPFDWDADGVADRIEVDSSTRTVAVRWATDTLTVVGLDWPAEGAAHPAAVADVTGDGWPDLIVVSHAEARVLVGPIATDRSAAVSFVDIGATVPGWISPPASDSNQQPVPRPDEPVSVRPLWDLDRDGADDFAVVASARRAAGPIARYAGRPCDGLPAGERLSHRPDMPHPEVIAGDRRPRSHTGSTGSTTGTGVVPTVTGTGPSTTIVPPPPPKKGRAPVSTVDAPDPTILRVASKYYLYTTNTYVFTQEMNVPVRRSSMLWDWDFPTDALPNVGSWSNSNHIGKVWAPAVHQFGGTYVLYYVSRVRAGLGADNRQCIGRATSSQPDGPFVDESPLPVVCQSLLGGSIDPHVFVDGSGVPWLTFKNDGNCCGLPSAIWSMQLSPDGLNVVGNPSLLYGTDLAWEGSVVENPALVRAGGVNWSFYSGNDWRTESYSMGYGWCWQGSGPCTKTTSAAPWLSNAETDYAKGPGGGDLFEDYNGNWWIVYHGWINGVGYEYGGVRGLFVDSVRFGPDGPEIDSNMPYESVLLRPPEVTGLTVVQTGHNTALTGWAPVVMDPPVDGYLLNFVDVNEPWGIGCFPYAADNVSELEVSCLQDGHTYDVRITARNVGGEGPPSAPVRLTMRDYGTRFVGVTPVRVLDTRDGTGVPDGSVNRVGPAQAIALPLGGRGGLPPAGGFSAVVLNLTVTGPSATSHLRVYPGYQSQPPEVSSINFDAGATIAAAVTVQTGADGTVKIYNNSGETHIIADLVGYFGAPDDASGALHRSISPARVLDTREGLGLEGGTPAKVGAQQSITLPLAERGGLPAAGQFSSVILNVTAVSGSQVSHVRVYPGDQPSPPFASSLNFNAGQTIANLVTVRTAADGTVKLYSQSGDVDLVADVVGYYGPLGGSSGAKFYAVPPYRPLDTRTWPPQSGMNPVPAGTPLGIFPYHPSLRWDEHVSSVVLTVTVDAPSAQSHLTVWPSDIEMPVVSNLNFVQGQVIANQASVRVGAVGEPPFAGYKVSAQNNAGTVQVIVDLNGWFGEEL